MIGSELIYGDYTKLKTSYDNIVEILNGEEILKFDKQILGNIIVPSYRSTTFLNTLELKDDTIMIVGDRHSLIEAAVNSKIKLLIIVGNSEIKPEHIQIARVNRVNIIRTKYDTFRASKLINLSNYCKNLLTDERNISFNENDYYDYFKERSMKYGYNNYPVIDNDGVCLGLIRITDINKKNRKKVILVDHNDSEQSAEGISEAEILEIVDHHNIGALTTNMPINFRSMTVGSTNTILYSMYVENNVQIPKQIAGLMLSGIISDTLKFTSPTTTEYDKFVADRLLSISGLDIDEYAKLMFKQGTKLKGKTIEEIIEGDLKTYNVDSKKIAISQVLTFDSDEFLNKKDDYLKAIDNMKKSRDFDLFVLCVTDILKSGSYIFYDEANEQIIQDAFNIDSIFEGFFLEKCLSRKKQVVPAIMNILR